MPIRAFLALPVPDPARAALVALQAGLPFGRKVPEENLHLTLVFLGEVAEAALEEIDAALAGAALPAPVLRFEALGTFAEMERGLVFAAVAEDAALTALHGRLCRIVRAAGVALPRRRFRPHVTLARSPRQPAGPARDRLAAALGQRLAVPEARPDRLGLFRSRLAPGGAVHDLMADYPLG